MEESQLSNDQAERRVGRGRQPACEMRPEEVVKLVDRLQESGVDVWLDGGWGVDALIGEQRRSHDDLDVVVDLDDVSQVQKALTAEGYVLLGGAAPMSFEMVDPEGRQIDVHPVAFNEAGDGIYKMRTGEEWVYPSSGLTGTGEILGQRVRCLTPEVQMLCHTGYELSKKDHEEIRALRDRFGVEPPPGYAGSSAERGPLPQRDGRV